MPQRKRSIWPRLILVLILGAGGYFGWRWYAKRNQEEPIEYRTGAITKGDIVQAVTANGQISPVKNVQVGSQVSGIIKKLYVDFNSPVTNGQVIAEIDPSTYQQNITQAEAEVANATAALAFAVLNHRRAKQLRDNDLIAPSEFEKTVAELQQAEAIVRMREASLKRAKVDLERTTIYSPVDGVVISRNVDEGQTVAASFSAPILFLIANDLKKMQIEAMVSEADVGGVEVGQKVNFTVEAFPSRQFRGQVKQVRYAPLTNQNVVNYTTVVEVNNSDLKLRPGMTATASIVTAEKTSVLRIANAALRFRPPENALPKATTNAPSGGGSRTNAPGSSTNAGPRFTQEGEGGGNRDEMRRRFESMTPEQREEARARFRARFGEGGGPPGGFGGGFGGPGGGGMGRQSSEGPVTRTVYVLDKSAGSAPGQAKLKPVQVKVGVSDGAFTEVIEGLKEGDEVVSGVNTPAAQTAAAGRPGATPFGGSPFGGFRPR